MADKIGNLVGQFDFSGPSFPSQMATMFELTVVSSALDEQLAVAQQGLQGLAMPNFNSVGNALAKECNIEPEEDAETEEEGTIILSARLSCSLILILSYSSGSVVARM